MCLLLRRHPLEPHPRGPPQLQVRVHVCGSRPPPAPRASMLATLKGFGLRNRLTTTRRNVAWRCPMVWVLGLLRCSCSSRLTLQSYRHKFQSWHPPTRRCHPRGLLIHCYSNHGHGCVVSASRRASSHADWRLLTRRHHLQCHPRGYAEIRVSRYRLAAPANGSQSRPALGLRVWVATSTG